MSYFCLYCYQKKLLNVLRTLSQTGYYFCHKKISAYSSMLCIVPKNVAGDYLMM